MAAPKIDVRAFGDRLAKISPAVSHAVLSRFLGIASPFNGHLRARIKEWTDEKCVFQMKNRRGVQNHLGGTHAGAIVAIGESTAALVILRHFSFENYRLILTEINAEYSKQGRGTLTATSELSVERREEALAQLEDGPTLLEMVTNIRREDDALVAAVRSTWQLKSWDQVRKK